MRIVLLSLFLAFFCRAGRAETLTVPSLQADNSQNYLLKTIKETVGNGWLRALVIDSDGNETMLYIMAHDAVEIKRGLWVIKPGRYQTAI